MNWFHTVIAVAMLALWAPVQSHCLLEQAELIPAPLHCAGNSVEDTESHPSEPCTDHPCCQFEKASYKTASDRLILLPPFTLFTFSVNFLDDALPRLSAPPDHTVAPPEIPVTWQFQVRAALPPRAPSLVS